MKVYKGRGPGDFYYELIRDITNEGVEIVTRGQRCLELPEPVTLVYTDPGYCWMDIPERKFNPFFAMAEVPWILSGNGNADWIGYFNKQMYEYLDEGSLEFHGSYGLRMRKWYGLQPDFSTGRHCVDQIQHVVRKLKEDPFSRQAAISLWDPIRDNLVKSKDIPCNNIVYYSLRNGVLNQTVVIRSNDVVWGTPHNAIQFTHLLALVAGNLGVRMGTLTYVVQNVHYYLDLYNPTLGHIVNAAMSNENLEALAIEGFCTTNDEEVKACVEMITRMKAGESFFMSQMDTRYWICTIPRLIWLYVLTKEPAPSTERGIGEIAERAKVALPPVLWRLVRAFWKDSKNPVAKAIADAL